MSIFENATTRVSRIFLSCTVLRKGCSNFLVLARCSVWKARHVSRQSQHCGRTIEFIIPKEPSGEYFKLDGASLMQTEERSEQLAEKVPMMIHVWQSLRELPAIKNASPKELPEVIKAHKIKIRDDRDDMRGFYANHRYPYFPPPDLIDEQWAYFRWIQVYLLVGLDFINRYGVNSVPSEENMIHELIDLDYLIPAILVGGLACREKMFLERFRLLRSDGVVLR